MDLWTHLGPHWIRVDLAHVWTPVLCLDPLNVEEPRVAIRMGDVDPRVVGDHVVMDRLDGLGVRFYPSDLDFFVVFIFFNIFYRSDLIFGNESIELIRRCKYSSNHKSIGLKQTYFYSESENIYLVANISTTYKIRKQIPMSY